jgi:putative transposase
MASTPPERSRKTSWKEFLTQHWDLIVAADFFTIEVWTGKGLRRFIVLFFIELSTRRVEIGGISPVANGLWMSQVARNLTNSEDGLLRGKRYLIHGRDPLFTAAFLSTLEDSGVQSIRLPPRSPNLKDYASYCTPFTEPGLVPFAASQDCFLLNLPGRFSGGGS